MDIKQKFKEAGLRDRLWLSGLCLFVFVLKLPYVFNRHVPTLFHDEAIYLFRARTITEYLSYFAPTWQLEIDGPFYAPLYSLYISAANIFTEGLPGSYQFTLLLNALVLSSICIPAYKIAEKKFPTKGLAVAFLVGMWSIPFSYSFLALSEALFIPLFLWAGWFYQRYADEPSARNLIAFGLVMGLCAATRNAAVVMVPGAVLICAVQRKGGRLGFAGLSTVALAAAAALLPWLLAKWVLHFAPPQLPAGQTAVFYLTKGLLAAVSSISSLTLYVEIWLAQISYINASSFGLLAFVLIIAFQRGKSEGRTKTGDGPLSVGYAFVVMSVLMVFPATLHMFVAQTDIIPAMVGDASMLSRYRMYGRYADMVVPVAVLYGSGVVLSQRVATLWERLFWVLAAVSAFALSLLFVPADFSSPYLNMGLGWLEYLKQNPLVPRAKLTALAAALVVFFLMLFLRGRLQWLLICVLVAAQALNSHYAFTSISYFEASVMPYFEKVKNNYTPGEKLLFISNRITGNLYYAAKVHARIPDVTKVVNLMLLNGESGHVALKEKLIPLAPSTPRGIYHDSWIQGLPGEAFIPTINIYPKAVLTIAVYVPKVSEWDYPIELQLDWRDTKKKYSLHPGEHLLTLQVDSTGPNNPEYLRVRTYVSHIAKGEDKRPRSVNIRYITAREQP